MLFFLSVGTGGKAGHRAAASVRRDRGFGEADGGAGPRLSPCPATPAACGACRGQARRKAAQQNATRVPERPQPSDRSVATVSDARRAPSPAERCREAGRGLGCARPARRLRGCASRNEWLLAATDRRLVAAKAPGAVNSGARRRRRQREQRRTTSAPATGCGWAASAGSNRDRRWCQWCRLSCLTRHRHEDAPGCDGARPVWHAGQLAGEGGSILPPFVWYAAALPWQFGLTGKPSALPVTAKCRQPCCHLAPSPGPPGPLCVCVCRPSASCWQSTSTPTPHCCSSPTATSAKRC